jgi:hypothetical protein
MRLCKDCRYYGANNEPKSHDAARPRIPQPGDHRLCLHADTISEVDPESGEGRRYTNVALAYNQRQYPRLAAILFRKCGTSARWFESREA